MTSIKCKQKASNLIKVISVLISGIKSQQAKKTFVIQYQNLLIFLRISLFHFIKSFFWSFNFMCAFNWLTEWKLQKLKNIWKKYLIHQKKLLKRKENNITPAKTNAPISQTSSERLKLTIQTYQMRNKELKNEAWTTSRGNIKSIFAS